MQLDIGPWNRQYIYISHYIIPSFTFCFLFTIGIIIFFQTCLIYWPPCLKSSQYRCHHCEILIKDDYCYNKLQQFRTSSWITDSNWEGFKPFVRSEKSWSIVQPSMNFSMNHFNQEFMYHKWIVGKHLETVPNLPHILDWSQLKRRLHFICWTGLVRLVRLERKKVFLVLPSACQILGMYWFWM